MRLLVLYASDLSSQSRVAPGGITANVRGYLGGLPQDWEIEVWGVGERGVVGSNTVREISLARRNVRLRPLVQAGPAAERRVPLSPRYSAALVRMAWQQRLHRCNWDVVIAHRTEYLAALALGYPLNCLPPAIAMIHSSPWYRKAMRPLRRRAQAIGERIAIQHADAIALVSGASLPQYQALYPRRADCFHWIPNGVDLTRFAGGPQDGWRERYGFRLQDRLLVYHGRYDREKGLQRMLDVLRILLKDDEPWHLVCAGVGPLRPLLFEAATGWAAGRVHDLGYLKPEAVVELLHAADLGLLCSDVEGLSNGLLEALAAGLPVVATDVGDNALVLHSLARELVTTLAPSAIAAAVRWAWENRSHLAQRARAVAQRFSLDARVTRLTALIQHVAARKVGGYGPEFVSS